MKLFPCWLQLALTFSFFFTPSQVTQASDADVGDQIRLIVGEGESMDYNVRIRAVRDLGFQLANADVEHLIDFLQKKLDEDIIKLAEFNAVKNDVVVWLLRQERTPANLAAKLQDGFRDKSMDSVWRDYCLQHLARCYQLSDERAEREDILATLMEATLSRESTFAGTALLTSRQIEKHSPGTFDPKDLEERALRVAANPEMPNPSRVSGLQLAASHPDALPLARELAEDSSADMLLRMSAINVLKGSRTPEDVNLLHEFASSSDVRLRASARAALRSRPE